MRRSIPAPTKAQQLRQDRARAIGCIACLMNRVRGRRMTGLRGELHHQQSGGRAIGQDESVILCEWHHQGDRYPAGFETCNRRDVANAFGPSLKHASRAFRETYGTDAEQLAFQNRLLERQAAE